MTISKRFAFPAAFGIVVGTVLLVVLALCRPAEVILRYRLTLTLEVEGSPISASAVQEIRATWNEPFIDIPGQTLFQVRQRGQAAELTMPDGSLLLVTMTTRQGGDSSDYLLRACHLLDTEITGREVVTQIGAFQGTCEIPAKLMPLIFKVEGEAVPIQGTRVDPEDVAASLGMGVSLGSMQLTTTTDSLVFDLEDRLPWLHSRTYPLVVVPGQLEGTRQYLELLPVLRTPS